MKEEDLIREMLQARVKYYRTITYVLLFLVCVCVLSLAGVMYWKKDTEREVVTLFIALTSTLFGSLMTIVTQGIQAARKLRSDEELTEELEKIHAKKLLERKEQNVGTNDT
jgi:TRAP-type C4-dicarboxylate transport system permease small subunit